MAAEPSKPTEAKKELVTAPIRVSVPYRHLERVLRAYAAHYNGYRPHRGLQLEAPERSDSPRRPENRGVRLIRRDVLGGLIHENEAAA